MGNPWKKGKVDCEGLISITIHLQPSAQRVINCAAGIGMMGGKPSPTLLMVILDAAKKNLGEMTFTDGLDNWWDSQDQD